VTRRELGFLAATAVVTAIAGVLRYSDASAVAAFAAASFALAGLAWVVALGTEQAATRFGPEVTGLAQASLGNLPELFIVIFALSSGELLVAQSSLVGSILANALLVQGIVIVTGAAVAEDGLMRFRRRLPQDAATLGMAALSVIVLVGVAISSGGPVSEHVQGLSIVGAICLLAVYAFWIWGYLRSDLAPPLEGEPRLSLGLAVGLLAAGGLGAGFASEWFIDALDPAVQSLGISKAFAGLVIAAIAGNAVEHATSVFFAAKGQSDLAISVVKSSASQIAAFLFPALVLISIPFATSLTFSLPSAYIAALFITALVSWQITGDGEARVFEGVALVAIYVVLAAFTLYD
jgi:Ca2+:H+ antiporter